jgi:hypothetical protein
MPAVQPSEIDVPTVSPVLLLLAILTPVLLMLVALALQRFETYVLSARPRDESLAPTISGAQHRLSSGGVVAIESAPGNHHGQPVTGRAELESGW